jgi:hypothetical protein
MNDDQLRQFAADPMLFINALMIPSARGPRRFHAVMADFQRERFAAIVPALLAVAKGEKPPIGKFWWEATKGASKDSDLACALLWLLAFSPRSLTIQIGAADQSQADEARKAAADILRLNTWLQARIEIQGTRILAIKRTPGKAKAIPTGSVADVIAADVVGSHGARPDFLLLNELSCVAKREFAETLMDNAAKIPHGVVVIATNAGFLGTWQHEWRELARNSDRWSFHQFAKPSPWLDPADIAEAERRNSASRFARLWYGAWVAASGDALDQERIELAYINNHKPMTGSEPNCGFVAGLDLSLKHDRSALVVLGWDWQSQRVKLAHVKTWRAVAGGRINFTEVQQYIVALAKRFNFADNCIAIDTWQHAQMVETFVNLGFNVAEVPPTAANLNSQARAIIEVFSEGVIDLFPHDELRRDLGLLCIKENGINNYKLVAARDSSGHADAAIALALALPYAANAAVTYRRNNPVRERPMETIFDDDFTHASPHSLAGQFLRGEI